MATTALLRNSNLQPPLRPPNKTNTFHKTTSNSNLHFNKTKWYTSRNAKISITCPYYLSPKLSSYSSFHKFLTPASTDEAVETEDAEKTETQDNTNGDVYVENEEKPVPEESSSPIIAALQFYKEASSNNDESKIAELETFFKSIEDEKNDLERKSASLSDDLYVEKERVLRISAEFDNFRKRTERERLSLVTNAKGEIIETFLPVLDNFERAKSQIKIGSEAEEKINNSYQSIYKQFVEILGSIGVASVETMGKPFDPMVHEAIMREDSTEYEEGVVIEEYRKGFALGDRLLRPSMVKVSAGPGPEKPETLEPAVEEDAPTDTSDDAGGEGDAKD